MAYSYTYPEPTSCLWPTEVVLTALYLAGAPRSGTLVRRHWRGVEATIRASGVALGAAPAELRRAGYWAEALALDTPGLLGWAADRVAGGQVLTAASSGYPSRWLEVLGAAAPPCIWVAESVADVSYAKGPESQVGFGAVVGSRHLSHSDRRRARQFGVEMARLGYRFCSGGAFGTDRQALRGAQIQGQFALANPMAVPVEIWPCGVGASPISPGVSVMSVCAPDEPFSTGRAMERNALIYAASEFAIVVRPRFRQGGSWQGATDALRRRLTRVFVVPSAEDPQGDVAARALAALGAEILTSPADLACALAAAPAGGLQPPLGLFFKVGGASGPGNP